MGKLFDKMIKTARQQQVNSDYELNRIKMTMHRQNEQLRREAWEADAPVREAAAMLVEHMNRRQEVQRPSLGRVVHVTLSDEQIARIPNKNNGARECPAMIVRVWSDTCVNLQAMPDGDGPLWLTSVVYGDEPGQWRWPVFVPPHVATSQDAKY